MMAMAETRKKEENIKFSAIKRTQNYLCKYFDLKEREHKCLLLNVGCA